MLAVWLCNTMQLKLSLLPHPPNPCISSGIVHKHKHARACTCTHGQVPSSENIKKMLDFVQMVHSKGVDV